MRVGSLLSAICGVLVICVPVARAELIETVAHWTFESASASGGPHLAELGTQAGVAQATAFHAAGSAEYKTPVGNGSAKSLSANYWTTIGDYIQFQVNLAGYSNAVIQWQQTRSLTGPSEFALQWSIDGSSFQLLDNYSVAAMSWTNLAPNGHSAFGPIALPSAVDDQPVVIVRLSSTASVVSSGTARIDNFTLAAAVIPEPSGLALLALAGGGQCLLRRRRYSLTTPQRSAVGWA